MIMKINVNNDDIKDPPIHFSILGIRIRIGITGHCDDSILKYIFFVAFFVRILHVY